VVWGFWLVGEWIELIFPSLLVFADGELRSRIEGAQRVSPADVISATPLSCGSNKYLCVSGLLLIWGIREIYSVGCLWFIIGGDQWRRAPIDWISTEYRDLVVFLIFSKACKFSGTPVPVSLVLSLSGSMYGSYLSNINVFYIKKLFYMFIIVCYISNLLINIRGGFEYFSQTYSLHPFLFTGQVPKHLYEPK
jgi:hypothetical protein